MAALIPQFEATPIFCSVAAAHRPMSPHGGPHPGASWTAPGAEAVVIGSSGIPSVPPSHLEWGRTLNAAAKRVELLNAGWDGPGSVPIARLALYRALGITVRALSGMPTPVAPYLVPGGDGSLQLEWHQLAGELELDIGSDGSMSIWVRDHQSGATYEGRDEEAANLFYRWAPRLAAKPNHASHAPLANTGSLFAVAA